MFGLVANIGSFLLAVYVSVTGKDRRLQAMAWSIAVIITLANVYAWIQQQEDKPYYDLTGPDISSVEAYDLLKGACEDELHGYDLIDVVGSYYICLEKPDVIFHRTPEWLFLLRNGTSGRLIEYKVSDASVPQPPPGDPEFTRASGGQIVYYVVCKKNYVFSGKNAGPNPLEHMLDLIDEEGRTLIVTQVHGPPDNIEETNDGINSRVLARVQVIGRPTDDVEEWVEVWMPNRNNKVRIKRASFQANEFYRTLGVIKGWRIDSDRAMRLSMKKGAHGFPLGKETIGGPGVLRLHDRPRYNVAGLFWDVPYKISNIRPVLIDACSGSVYAINNAGEYSTKWEKDFRITGD